LGFELRSFAKGVSFIEKTLNTDLVSSEEFLHTQSGVTPKREKYKLAGII